MRTVFVDTLYWVARVRPCDPWGEAARLAKSSLGAVRLLTTDEVLTEFLTALSRGGEHLRRQAVRMVRSILDDPNVQVTPQSRNSFLRGIELYEQRPDKEYSLTDCISMSTMRSLSVAEVLTNDTHFNQEGFRVLITKQES
ncbi:MAG: type II toxin-antitoxin system VapC family toxin [Candidatus Tectomicrobia bacterium]|nr:type II toxin-antitoxin system VapC family toxin [Candidatus Tectomicrobia bacterium]